ncbi:signal peptide peptidase SppA [Xylanibacter muris]|uniref:Signal peptide peptidase SppA n=1 Tax=Xylanibacter muris TaxID=2736290 RepID=A0ABX2AML3_9BACT|nr:signal peptide peptidase SppA [Xylanibacter muris]NPD91282.1 signal peptide peptidase SppA [Xylanibacter muris]
MKDFLKNILSTMIGVIMVFSLMGVLGIISLVGMIVSGSGTVEVKDNSVMVINLSGVMEERAADDPMAQFTGRVGTSIGLDGVLSAVKKAKENKCVKGIYIEAGLFSADSPASVQALRDALEDFKSSGKWIISYADSYTQSTYYICSVADKVLLNPQGMIDWHGLAAQPMFFKDVLAKFGVKVQLSKVGKYKSAPEQFTADGMSEANREQTTAYIKGVWDEYLSDVSKSRKLSKQTLNAYADSFITFADQKDYVKLKLVDGLCYTDEVADVVKKQLGLSADDKINRITSGDLNQVSSGDDDGDEIAVYYAYGDVVDSNPGGIGSSACIDAQKVCRDLKSLADDDDVKAVVLRINSGGGSAYASEQIWHSVVNLKKKKPVVVSMGGYAASGAYYISCPANYIYAEPTTLTGSIGIFGMFPDFSELLTEKLGIRFDEVKTNKFSAFGTPVRPFTAEEMTHINSYIDRGYKLFRQRVADGRKLPVDKVEEIAQGRVWLARDAVGIKLVDGLGSLDDAVEKAAGLAKVKTWHTESYPAPPSWLDQIMTTMSTDTYIDGKLRETMGGYYPMFMYLRQLDKHSAIQARMPYMLDIR